jgi:hypothetical protein
MLFFIMHACTWDEITIGVSAKNNGKKKEKKKKKKKSPSNPKSPDGDPTNNPGNSIAK